MKAREIIKRAVTVIAVILLAVDMLTEIDAFPFALLFLSVFEFIKSREFREKEDKTMAILSLIAGIVAAVGFLFSFII